MNVFLTFFAYLIIFIGLLIAYGAAIDDNARREQKVTSLLIIAFFIYFPILYLTGGYPQ